MIFQAIASTAKVFCGEIFDVLEQRTRIAEDFACVRSYKLSNGLKLFYRSEQYGIIIPITLKNRNANTCQLTIDAGSIVEQKGISCRLMRLSILPDLLSSHVGDEGNFLLPVWSGALVDFRERQAVKNSDRIYMEQREWEKFSMMNCFGTLQPNKNILAIVSEGDFACQIDSEYNQDGINRIYPTFIIRKHMSDMIKCENSTVIYTDCGRKCDYDDMAKIYREYLMEERHASLLKDRMQDNPTLQYSAEAMRVKFFMACKEPYVPDGSSPVTVQTTFAEAIQIMDEMKSAGIDKATITLVGWNLGGHDGAYPTRFPVEPALGGETGLKQLIAHAKEIGYKIVPHDNWTDVYRSSPDFDYEYVARTEGGEPLAAGIWSGGQSYKICPQVVLQRYGYEFDRIHSLGFEGHYYMDAQPTVMWSCHSPKHPADEREFARKLTAVTEIPRLLYGAIGTEGVSAYSLQYTDEAAAIKCPVNDSMLKNMMPESIRKLDPYAIPFFHIAVHGMILHQNCWINCYDDVTKGKLLELAFAARPCMEICFKKNGGNGGDYRAWIPEITEPYRLCFKEMKTATAVIEKLKEPARGVYELSFSNGISYIVNSTETAYNGLAARSWKYAK